MIDEVNAMTGVVPKHILAEENHARHACFDKAAAPGIDVLVPLSARGETSRSARPAHGASHDARAPEKF